MSQDLLFQNLFMVSQRDSKNKISSYGLAIYFKGDDFMNSEIAFIVINFWKSSVKTKFDETFLQRHSVQKQAVMKPKIQLIHIISSCLHVP